MTDGAGNVQNLFACEVAPRKRSFLTKHVHNHEWAGHVDVGSHVFQNISDMDGPCCACTTHSQACNVPTGAQGPVLVRSWVLMQDCRLLTAIGHKMGPLRSGRNEGPLQ